MKHTPRDIKKQAQIIKQENPALKLTSIQHELAKKMVLSHFRHF